MVEEISDMQVSDLPVRKLTGYFGTVSGVIPQDFIAHVINDQEGYLVFGLYALVMDAENSASEGIWPLGPSDVEIFEKINSTITMEVTQIESLDDVDQANPSDTQPGQAVQDGKTSSAYWVTMEDIHYGVRFAILCFRRAVLSSRINWI